MERNRAELLARFPKLGKRLLSQFGDLPGPGFSIAVLEEFVLISILTLVSVENNWYNLWTGLMLVFFLHLLVHVGQFLTFRKYIPAIATSFLSMIYCCYALKFMNDHGLIVWLETAKWFAIFAVAFALNLAFAHRLGKLVNKVIS
jgi:hypothetical protein